MTTYNPEALDMAADISDSLSTDEIRNVRALVAHIAEAPEGDVQFGEHIPLVRNGGGSLGDIVIDDDDNWVFELAVKKSKKSADTDADDDEEPEKSPRSRRR